jgi:hypothetical protein
MKLLWLGIFLVLAGCGSSTSSAPSGMTISADFVCTASDSGTGTSILFIYRKTTFSTGDVFVEGEVDTTSSNSASSFYKAGSNGTLNGSINVITALSGDIDGSVWQFSSAIGASSSSVTYQSAGSPHNGYKVTLSNCSSS